MVRGSRGQGRGARGFQLVLCSSLHPFVPTAGPADSLLPPGHELSLDGPASASGCAWLVLTHALGFPAFPTSHKVNSHHNPWRSSWF